MNPKISIIVTTYNSERFVQKMRAYLKKIENAEIIYVDDGSIDKTIDAVKENFDASRERLILETHKGVSNSRNIGLNAAKGEYVSYVDVDDYIDSTTLNYILSKAKIAEYDIISTGAERKGTVADSKSRYQIAEAISIGQSVHGYVGGPYKKIFKTEFLKSNSLHFTEGIYRGEDVIFNINAILLSNSILLLKENFYSQINNQSSVSHKLPFDILKNSFRYVQAASESFYRKNILIKDSKNTCKLIVTNSWVNDSIKAARFGYSVESFKHYTSILFPNKVHLMDVKYVTTSRNKVVFVLLRFHGYSLIRMGLFRK